MASTFVDNYTLVDSINSDTHHSNQGDATLTIDSYTPTSASVHTIPTALRDLSSGALKDDGFSQKALYELFLMINVNWDNAMKQLDDSSLGYTNYEDSCSIGALNADYLATDATTFGATATALTLMPGLDRRINLSPEGMGTREIAIFCQAIATSFAACTANADADGTLDDTDYASTLDIDFTAKTGWVPPLATTTAFDVTSSASKIKTTGIDQGALIDFLNTVVTQTNLLWVKLDADI